MHALITWDCLLLPFPTLQRLNHAASNMQCWHQLSTRHALHTRSMLIFYSTVNYSAAWFASLLWL